MNCCASWPCLSVKNPLSKLASFHLPRVHLLLHALQGPWCLHCCRLVDQFRFADYWFKQFVWSTGAPQCSSRFCICEVHFVDRYLEALNGGPSWSLFWLWRSKVLVEQKSRESQGLICSINYSVSHLSSDLWITTSRFMATFPGLSGKRSVLGLLRMCTNLLSWCRSQDP